LTEDVALRALGALVLGGLAFAVVPMGFLAWLMLKREDVPSLTALGFAALVLVAEIMSSGIARPPPEMAGPWTLRTAFGTAFVPGMGAIAAYGLLRYHERRRSQTRGGRS